jgi:IS4 transposase
VLTFARQRLPNWIGPSFAHRVIQASARLRIVPGSQVAGVRRFASTYQRCLQWDIELFFKWIKQHLRIKRFYGTSENAVKTQIWIAVSVYVLVAIVRKRLNIEASLYTLMQVFSVAIFEKVAIRTAFLPGIYGFDGDIENKQLNLFGF